MRDKAVWHTPVALPVVPNKTPKWNVIPTIYVPLVHAMFYTVAKNRLKSRAKWSAVYTRTHSCDTV